MLAGSSAIWLMRLWALIRAILIIGLSYIILYPILLKISVAFKSRADLTNPTVIWIPQTFSLDNFRIVFSAIDFWQAFSNTLALAVLSTVLQTACCALAGYAFARLPFRGQGVLFIGVLLTIIVPPQTLMVPTYLHFRYFDVMGIMQMLTGRPGVNLLDSFWPFILLSITGAGLKNGLYIFIFRQVFRSLPKELEESALVDGCGFMRIFTRVMLPNVMPSLVTVMLFSFVWQWNDVYYVSTYLTEMPVLSTALQNLPATLENYFRLQHQAYDPGYGSMLQNTLALLVIAPLLAIYAIAQRHFVEGVERSGIVG